MKIWDEFVVPFLNITFMVVVVVVIVRHVNKPDTMYQVNCTSGHTSSVLRLSEVVVDGGMVKEYKNGEMFGYKMKAGERCKKSIIYNEEEK